MGALQGLRVSSLRPALPGALAAVKRRREQWTIFLCEGCGRAAFGCRGHQWCPKTDRIERQEPVVVARVEPLTTKLQALVRRIDEGAGKP
jgi:hypothetical protein